MTAHRSVKHQALDKGWGWIVVMSSFNSHVLIAALYFAYGVLTPQWIEEFKSSSAMASMVGSTAAAFTSMSAPLASLVQHRWGCRCCHMIGGLMVFIGTLLSSRASSLFQIFIFYGIIGGTGLGLCYVPNIISISQYFKTKRALAIGIASSGVGVGSFVFPILMEILQDEYGWRGSMLILSATLGNMCVSAAVLFPVSHFQSSLKPSKRSQSNVVLSINCDDDVRPDDDVFNYPDINQNTKKNVKPEALAQNVKQKKNSFSMVRNMASHPWLRRQSSLATSQNAHRENVTEILEDTTIQCYDETSPENTCYSDQMNLTSSIHDVAASRASKLSAVSTSSPRLSFCGQLRVLFCNPLFYLMTVSNITMFIGMMVVYGLTPVRAVSDLGFSSAESAALVSGLGFANLIGRFSWGALSNVFPRSNPIVWFVCLRTVASLLTLLSPLATTYALQMTYCVFVGLGFGAWSLYPLVLAKMFGDKGLSVAFGILEFFDGVGSLVGPALGGLIYDKTGSYQQSFIMGGTVLGIGSVIVGAGSYILRNRMPK